jgi:hypothetical protein
LLTLVPWQTGARKSNLVDDDPEHAFCSFLALVLMNELEDRNGTRKSEVE